MPTDGFKRVLVVDDEESIRQLLKNVLGREGLEVSLAASGAEALVALEHEPIDVVLADVRMPGMSGLELLAEVQQRWPELVILIMSAYGSVDAAIEALKQGAYDYIAKPFRPVEAVLMIRKAEERERLRRENRRLRSDLAQIQGQQVAGIVTRSPAMEQVLRTVLKLADYKTTVLVQGESGTGKELVARAIHQQGSRARAPFVAVNCGAIPESLLESELFGHRKGAFTDATQDKKGLFAEADGGTLLLDEIGELPLSLQVKLLRVLQEEEVRRLGDAKSVKIDVRVVAATVRDLHQEVQAGRFREDLFYRLNVMPLTLPPLRERPEDIPLLVEYAIARHNKRLGLEVASVSREVMKALIAHPWPGNVRELENTIEHAMVLAEGPRIEVANLPSRLRADGDPVERALRHGTLSIKQNNRIIEEALIRRALAQTGGNRTTAARMLEISHRALLYKIKDYLITDL
ncbi:MAG: sigma-54-dependent Fis family transcriptional regulator [Proteobacteria bacterium]|nr:sigma-54-dependent Fis family transcriptional regulator [Pseudomonadota bacterium]